MPQQTTTPAPAEVRRNSKWPYMAALAIALSVPPELAPTNADAFVVKSRMLAYMPNVERISGVKMVRELGQLLTSSLDDGFRFTVGKKALEAMMAPDDKACKGLSEWVGRRIGIHQKKLFDQVLRQLEKGNTDVLN